MFSTEIVKSSSLWCPRRTGGSDISIQLWNLDPYHRRAMRRSGEKISFLASTVWCNESHWLPFIPHSVFVQGWRWDLIRELDTLQCTVNSFLYMMLSILIRITQNIFNIEKRLKFQFTLDCSSIFKYWIDFCYDYWKTHLFLSVRVMNGAMMLKQTQTPLDVLGNWPGVEGGGWLS